MSLSQYPPKMVGMMEYSKKGLKIVNKRVVAKATLYGFVCWYDTRRKKLINKKEKAWQL